MRRLVALLVIALVGATLYGLSNLTSGVSVDGSRVASSTFRAELSAISSNATLSCYVAALDPASFALGGGGASVTAAGVAAWANLRVEGIAIEKFAATSLRFRPTAATLSAAQTSLEGELSAASSSLSTPCTGTSAEAISEMPAEMRTFEIAAQAASLDLVTKLNGTVKLTTANLQTYYSTHVASYDTICVSVAVVELNKVTNFNEAQSEGKTVAELAEQFSEDSSRANGGALGCYGPTSTSYSGVRSDTLSTPLNTFPTTPQYINDNGTEVALFVAPTKRTTTPFAQAESSVLADLENSNAASANTEKERILYNDAVSIDPAFGRWGLTTTGPSVFAPALPPKSVVGSSVITALGSASTYK